MEVMDLVHNLWEYKVKRSTQTKTYQDFRYVLERPWTTTPVVGVTQNRHRVVWCSQIPGRTWIFWLISLDSGFSFWTCHIVLEQKLAKRQRKVLQREQSSTNKNWFTDKSLCWDQFRGNYEFWKCLENEEKKPKQTDDEANHEPPKCARLIGSWPEHCQEVDSAYGRRQVAVRKSWRKYLEVFFVI